MDSSPNPKADKSKPPHGQEPNESWQLFDYGIGPHSADRGDTPTLEISGVIQNTPKLENVLVSTVLQSQYTNSNKPLTDLELDEISENLNVGRWNLYGAIPGSPGGTSILLSDRQSNDRDAKAHMFVVGAREMHHIVCILFDRKDPDSRNRAYKLIQVLIAEAADRAGFNENAQMKLNEKLKNTHDPKGTLCPGKNGIWPANYRKED
ncbi:hypothetical protein AFCA_003830 [Aspergillus flavus]|nr:uncharacterized protein G4B84_003567 [Aspergillus flavus NRRL3357]QMW28278.1 hypothetical protein G4B84_003567 [Aspergillus flavus NRRL3357]UDD56278.1 hypothetical protein AFCA_003830 [Aspergillus flavus]